MAERRHQGNTIAVEEVRLDATDGAAAPEPERSDRRAPRRRRTAAIAGAVVGALAAGTTLIAVWDPSQRDEGATPSTTIAPGPVHATGRADRRAVLTELPSGFRATGVRETRGDPVQPPTAAVLYSAPGASVDDGEWLLTLVSPAAASLPLDVGFLRPARSTFIGSEPGVVGRGSFGDETTAFDRPQGRITLIAHGLAPGTTEAIARVVRVEDGAVIVPETDVPAGLVQQPTWRVPRGLAVASALADTGQPDSWSASYRSADGGAIDVAVSAIAADQLAAVAPLSEFFLTDASTAVVRGRPAVIGRLGDVVWVVWTEDAALVTVALTGVEPTTSAQLSNSLRLASDDEWDESAWVTAARGNDPSPAPSGVTMRIVGRGSLRGATSWWDVTAGVDGTQLVWTLRTGHNVVPSDTASDDNWAPITPPLTLVASGHQMFSRDPPGADAGEVSDWYAVAIAVGDASLSGAVLRLTTDGMTPATHQVVLAPIRGVDGYVVAAAALPWTDHYTAEVIGTDGTVLGATTDTDAV